MEPVTSAWIEGSVRYLGRVFNSDGRVSSWAVLTEPFDVGSCQGGVFSPVQTFGHHTESGPVGPGEVTINIHRVWVGEGSQVIASREMVGQLRDAERRAEEAETRLAAALADLAVLKRLFGPSSLSTE